MPSPRPSRSRTESSMSFNGRGTTVMAELKRPRTVSDLRAAEGVVAREKVMTKVLMKVRIEGSVGGVQVLVSPGNTVGELIMAVVKQYVKEGRRPLILVKDVAHFDLHYSQFSLESLDREEKLAALGSRNFFMCKSRKAAVAADNSPYDSCRDGGSTSSSCSKQAEKASKLGFPYPWPKFMSFLL